jgi:glycosyltransferase involved in cell wall biosynthesis
MNKKQRALFLFPYDWLRNPRSVREVSLLNEHCLEPLIIWTDLKYVLKSDIGVMSSPRLENSSEKYLSYEIPFFVNPFASKKRGMSKVLFLMFYAISITFYSFWLFFLTFLLCITKRVRVIHAHDNPDIAGLVAFFVSKILGIPYVFEAHDLVPELYVEEMHLTENGFIYGFLKKIEWVIVTNSAFNIVISEAMKTFYESSYELDSSKIVVVYSSWTKEFANIYRYRDDELQTLSKENALDGKFKILYLGSLEDAYRRGLDLLILCLKYLVYTYGLDDVVLIFVGDGGGNKERLCQLATECKVGDSTYFLGELPRQQAYKWLSLADVTVVPTRKAASTEIGVGNKTLEYMAAAKAIIASDLAGDREVIKNGRSGLLFRPNDHVDLATKIFLLTKTPNLIQRLGLNARKEFVERFCWEKQQIKILRLYDDILQNAQATVCATE